MSEVVFVFYIIYRFAGYHLLYKIFLILISLYNCDSGKTESSIKNETYLIGRIHTELLCCGRKPNQPERQVNKINTLLGYNSFCPRFYNR